MKVLFTCPSATYPIGGVTVMYELANALARRGHHVTLAHLDFYHCRIESLADLDWFSFEPSVRHVLVGSTPLVDVAELEPADVVVSTGAPRSLGLPVLLFQGVEMLLPELEEQGLGTPCLKVCVASWLIDVAVALGVPETQCRVVPLGIDLDRFRVTTDPAVREPSIAVLHHSHPAKGWLVARTVLERVHRQRPDVRIRAFGTAEPDPPLPDWIDFSLDPPSEHLVDGIYNASQVFLQASVQEGFGVTAVEAMACGCALATTDNGGSRDYARHGETAVVVPQGDIHGLTDAVLRLLDDADLRFRLAAAGTAQASELDWDHAGQLLEACLEEYVADPGVFLEPRGPVSELVRDAGSDWISRVLGETQPASLAAPVDPARAVP